MSRDWIGKAATALVVLAAAGVLAVGAWRAVTDGGPQAKIARMIWSRMLPGKDPASRIRIVRDSRRRELLAVLIVTSACGGTRNPDFVPAVRAMKAELVRRSAAQGKTLRLIGVATDDRMSDGMMLLNRIGPFDEISVGGNWMNSNAVTYVWRSSKRSTAIPQWVLMERDVAVNRDAISVAPDSVVAVISGADRMRAWIRASQREVRTRVQRIPAAATR